MEIFNEISFESIKDDFFDMARYCHRYIILSDIKPLDIIHEIFSIEETPMKRDPFDSRVVSLDSLLKCNTRALF